MADIKVLMIEDHEMTRIALSLVLERADGIELVDTAEDGLSGINKAKLLSPDIILMDIGLPEIDGIEATKIIKNYNPEMKILMYTSRDNEDDVLAAFESGADGYIMKGATREQTISALKAVSQGTAWIDPNIARIVLSNIKRNRTSSLQSTEDSTSMNKTNAKQTYGLTERELEVLALIVNGLSNKEISDELVISYATAKAHVHSILQKLCTENRTKAINLAMKEGLV